MSFAVNGVAFTAFVLLSITCSVAVRHDVIRFSEQERDEVVKMHNDLRRSIYNAANMRELTWSEAAAEAALKWGEKCEYISRPDRSKDQGQNWGQNMNYFHGHNYHWGAFQQFNDSFTAWSNENKHYDYRRFSSCGSKNVCSYVQLIAADIQEVGCSIVKCPELQLKEPTGVQNKAKLLVCFYSPWIDILNKEVFIPERRCSACPPGTTCVDSLCSARFHTAETVQLSSIGASSVKISSISGRRASKPEVTLVRTSGDQSATRRDRTRSNTGRKRQRGERRQDNGDRNRNRYGDRRIKSKDELSQELKEARKKPESFAVLDKNNDTHVVYTPNTRVVPFPGRNESREVRRVERYLKKNKKASDDEVDLKPPPGVTMSANSTGSTNSRQKRQASRYRPLSYEDALYLRRLEYQRYIRERERLIRERAESRRQHEMLLKREEEDRLRRERHLRHQMALRRTEAEKNQQVAQEIRRQTDDDRRMQERRRRQHQRELRRRRVETLALELPSGELTGEEQFFTVSAHNLLRQEAGARDLSWSSHLERWAQYVIRCDTEYPGPITCYTNFGKADFGNDIYSVVYQWGTEGNDMRKPLQYGCRTPYDRSSCNHNTIITNKALTQMACAAMNCGNQRQLTCIYNTN